MENYARHDTHYLKPLSDILKTELAAKGRTSWQTESCARLVADCAQLRPADPDLVWRLKGSHRLPPPALAILRELWHWRESEATAANKPPYFILRHEALIDIALAAVENRPVAPLVPPKFSDRRRQGLASAVQAGLAVTPAQQPRHLQHTSRRLSDADKHRLEAIQKRRDARAVELGIDPTIIASRATMIDLADDWDLHQKDLMNWQRELLK
jgi:ribonuclease D